MMVKKGKLKYYCLYGLVWALLFACADPERAYDPSMKHESPNVEYMPDMYRSQAYETYSTNPNFGDSMSARLPVKGTIPRGYVPYEYPNTNEGYEAAGNELKNPIVLTEQVLMEGEKIYMTFCDHCHGATGMADGKVVTNGGFPPPPAYSSLQLKDLSEGKMFHSITYGKNLMGSHASQLNSEERWKVIHFVQTLQGIDNEVNTETNNQ